MIIKSVTEEKKLKHKHTDTVATTQGGMWRSRENLEWTAVLQLCHSFGIVVFPILILFPDFMRLSPKIKDYISLLR